MTALRKTGLVHPAILSGGSGTRLWPLSRREFPKQLLPLVTPATLLQETAGRMSGARFAAPLIVCNRDHRFLIAEQLRGAGIGGATIVLEPAGRNTAPAAVVAALLAAESDADAIVLLAPSDHAVRNIAAFESAVAAATAAARAGALVTFGVTPDGPETGAGRCAGRVSRRALRGKAGSQDGQELSRGRRLFLEQRHVSVFRSHAVAG